MHTTGKKKQRIYRSVIGRQIGIVRSKHVNVSSSASDVGYCSLLINLGPLAQRKSKPLIMVRSRYRNSQGPPFCRSGVTVAQESPKLFVGVQILPAAPFLA